MYALGNGACDLGGIHASLRRLARWPSPYDGRRVGLLADGGGGGERPYARREAQRAQRLLQELVVRPAARQENRPAVAAQRVAEHGRQLGLPERHVGLVLGEGVHHLAVT